MKRSTQHGEETMPRFIRAGLALALTLGLGACASETDETSAGDTTETTAAPTATTTAAPTATTTTAPPLTVVDVIDGDTLTMSDGSKIRLIGIDTPEVGVCGSTEAAAYLSEFVADATVALTPGARDDADRYGRLLRYVEVEGKGDAGLSLIQGGFAVARYDSRDGYGAHPQEQAYIDADGATPDFTCAPVATEPAGPPSVYYENCAAVRAAGAAPIHRDEPGYGDHLDRDGDGVACES